MERRKCLRTSSPGPSALLLHFFVKENYNTSGLRVKREIALTGIGVQCNPEERKQQAPPGRRASVAEANPLLRTLNSVYVYVVIPQAPDRSPAAPGPLTRCPGAAHPTPQCMPAERRTPPTRSEYSTVSKRNRDKIRDSCHATRGARTHSAKYCPLRPGLQHALCVGCAAGSRSCGKVLGTYTPPIRRLRASKPSSNRPKLFACYSSSTTRKVSLRSGLGA